MQPNASPRPVMDVTAPKPATTPSTTDTAAPLAVHEAPASNQASDTSDNKKLPITASAEAVKPPAAKAEQQPKRAAKPITANPLPTGAITVAILAMVILSAIAIMLYLKG